MTREEKEMWSNIEKLSELRSKYSCFDEEEKPFYHALSLGIKALKQTDVLDKIRSEIEHIGGDDKKAFCKNLNESYKQGLKDALKVIDKYKAESEEKG